MTKLLSTAMVSIIRAFTGSSFVEKEVMAKLPKTVPIKFVPELDEEGNPMIFIFSPKYEGIISQARSMDEAMKNAHDAILTHFDVPRECAKAIKFNVVEAQQMEMPEERPTARQKDFRLVTKENDKVAAIS